MLCHRLAAIWFVFPLIIAVAAMRCKPDESGPVDYDRSLLLQNIAENLILPAYADLSVTAESLQAGTADFTGSTELSALETLQQLLQDVYVRWLRCSAFEFGPAAHHGERRA